MKNDKDRKLFFYLLTLSVAFFLFKGIRYALIGSYFPLLFISAVILCLSTFMIKDKKYFRLTVATWSIMLSFWALIRLVLPLLLHFSPQVTETHIREQFTPLEFLVSGVVLALGYYLWRFRTRV